MQRKATKKTRGPNAAEKRFQGFIKELECTWCNNPSPSIVDHIRGATFRHNKVLIGHWFVLPNCQECDKQKTIDGRKLGDYSKAWLSEISIYPKAHEIPEEVIEAIRHWGTTWQNSN